MRTKLLLYLIFHLNLAIIKMHRTFYGIPHAYYIIWKKKNRNWYSFLMCWLMDMLKKICLHSTVSLTMFVTKHWSCLHLYMCIIIEISSLTVCAVSISIVSCILAQFCFALKRSMFLFIPKHCKHWIHTWVQYGLLLVSDLYSQNFWLMTIVSGQ